MLLLKYMLLLTGLGMLAAAAAILVRDLKQRNTNPDAGFHWAIALRLAAFAIVPLILGSAIVIVPPGTAGLRISQFGGVSPYTLYPGVYWAWPMFERIEHFEMRDSVYATPAPNDEKKKAETLRIHTKEGLGAGLGIAVRYRIDPSKLAYVYNNLPQPFEESIVAPIVASQFRDAAPIYGVRELFSSKREEFRASAAGAITKKLAADGIVVKEVLLRDVVLPHEFAKGLETMLLKEQESERLTVELDAKQKQVKVEALEADSRKNTTIKEAEAQAQSKLLDSRAELEKLKLLAEAEEFKVRKLAGANAEKMRLEADVLRQNPMVIQKIIAERLSDKVQIMMVPSDGKYFFANDVLRGGMMQQQMPQQP